MIQVNDKGVNIKHKL